MGSVIIHRHRLCRKCINVFVSVTPSALELSDYRLVYVQFFGVILFFSFLYAVELPLKTHKQTLHESQYRLRVGYVIVWPVISMLSAHATTILEGHKRE